MLNFILRWGHATFFIFEQALIIERDLKSISSVGSSRDTIWLIKVKLNKHQIFRVVSALPGESKTISTKMFRIKWQQMSIQTKIYCVINADCSIIDPWKPFKVSDSISLNTALLVLQKSLRRPLMFRLRKRLVLCSYFKIHCCVESEHN